MKKNLFLMFVLLCAAAQGAWADTYDYPEKTKPEFHASYDGKSNVVVINTPAELAYITEHFDENSEFPVGDDDWSELNYYLNADIDMGTSYSWMPLGRESNIITRYRGTFWGNGHTIRYKIWNLDEENQGLFSTIHKEGKVYNVNVVCDIFSCKDYVGGIAGACYGLIDGCTVTADIRSDEEYVGGIAGYLDDVGSIVNCKVSGLINCGQSKGVGGIVGKYGTNTPAKGKISNCWVSADVISNYDGYDPVRIGGIAGTVGPEGNIEYCCVTGNVIAPNTGPIGGIIAMTASSITLNHVTVYGTIVSPYQTLDNWVGLNPNNSYTMTNNHNADDLADAAALASYLASFSGNDVYRYALQYPYAINVLRNELGNVCVSADGENDITKWRPNSTITVTVEPGTKVGWINVRDADANTVSVNSTASGYTFTMPKRDVDISIYFEVPDWPTQGTGTEDDPYLITNEADWGGFAYNVVYGNTFKGKYVKLTSDISVSAMAGRYGATFEGIFDGGGHKLTFTKGSSAKPFNEEYCAPFSYLKDGTVKNLHVDGTIYTSAKYAGGLVGRSLGEVTITNCRSSVTINSSVSGEGRHGGLVGALESLENHATISGCTFDGSFATTGGTTDCSGFIGYIWYNSATTILNSLMKPASVAEGMLVKTFADWYPTFEPTIINCYYVGTANLPTNQGKQPHAITAGDAYTTIETITPVGRKVATYDVAGIIAYNDDNSIAPFVNGLVCGSTVYCGDGDKVTLTLTNNHPAPGENLQYTYISSAGTLSGNTLLMPDADVTISLDLDHPVPLDWATVSTGTQDDPYKIYTAEQLDLLAQRVKESQDRLNYVGKYFKLMNDIEYSHTTAWDDASSTENNFTPIGNKDHRFCGYFDGNGHTISGIRIYKPKGENLGLFGFIDWGTQGHGANIHDLTLADARIAGQVFIGGIVGRNEGEDEHGTTITRCHVAANVAIHAVFGDKSYSWGYGGIIGDNYNNITISHCTSAVTITAEDGCWRFGAIAGHNEFGGTLSDNLAIGATIPADAYNNYGAICGANSGTLQRNYYIGCTVSGVPNATNVGCNNSDITGNNGAVPAYSINPGEYVTIEKAGTIGVVYDNVLYAGSGDEVSLTLGSNHSTFNATGYQASAGTLTGSGNPYTLTMPASNVTINVSSWSSALSGIGTVGNPFLIGTATDWDNFADYVNNGYTFSGEYVKQTANISVSTMAGTSSNQFQGTFDGDNNTLTFNKGTEEIPFTEQYCAPFRHVKNAVIKNLHVDGSIYTSVQNAAGFVGESHGALTITNCRSSVNIHSSKSDDGTHGGFVATLSGANNVITIDGCVFDGSFATTASTGNCGGFIGWPVWNRPTIKNSLMKPSSVDEGMLNNTFARWHDGYEPTITNCYFVAAANLPTNQGTQAYAVNDAPANLGNLVQNYGIVKAYANGILFDGKYYVAPATVTLADGSDNSTTITGADGYVADVTLSGRTLYKDGAWNTICLPFDVTIAGSPLAGATARPLTGASISGSTLTLTFGDAVTTLEAGTPYIIKWTADANYVDDDEHNIVSPVFSGVTIDADADGNYDNGVSGDERVRFMGTYKSTAFDAEDKSILLMGGANTLYYPTAGAGIGAQRAYFKIGSDGALLARRLTAFNIDFGDDETTGIISTTNYTNDTNSDAWFTLDGRRLSAKPSRAGVYINKGIKVVIK